jgi:hypothetical protein
MPLDMSVLHISYGNIFCICNILAILRNIQLGEKLEKKVIVELEPCYFVWLLLDIGN